MANRDTSRNSSNRVSFVDISGVPCSDLGDLKQRRIWSFHLLSSFIVEHTISVLNPQSLITFLTQDFRNKECFDQDPPQKTNLCIDLLWRRLNKKVINIILQHKHFLLRCWLGIIFKKYNMLRTFREVFPQYTTDLLYADEKLVKNKCLNEYLICAPLSAGFVCDESIFTGHTVKVVVRWFSTQKVQLEAKQRQLSNLKRESKSWY